MSPNSERRCVEMKTLLATLFAAMVLLVFAAGAGAIMPAGPSVRPPVTTSATTDTGGGGTEWYVYALAGLSGVIIGGTAYAVNTTAHRHGPHRPVATH
jgi:hypothetical protein